MSGTKTIYVEIEPLKAVPASDVTTADFTVDGQPVVDVGPANAANPNVPEYIVPGGSTVGEQFHIVAESTTPFPPSLLPSSANPALPGYYNITSIGGVTWYYTEYPEALKVPDDYVIPPTFDSFPEVFTDNSDAVDFNNLAPQQTAAIKAGAQTHDAMAGNDTVNLPQTTAAIASSGYDFTQPFHGGAGNDSITSGAFASVIYGDAGNDTIVGSPGNDTLIGGPGSDVLDGGAGDDILYADNGPSIDNDGDAPNVLDGGDGNDTLWGINNVAGDRLTGGSGNNLFAVDNGDIITDFNPADEIIVSSNDDVNQVVASWQSNVVTLTFYKFDGTKYTPNSSITLQNVPDLNVNQIQVGSTTFANTVSVTYGASELPAATSLSQQLQAFGEAYTQIIEKGVEYLKEKEIEFVKDKFTETFWDQVFKTYFPGYTIPATLGQVASELAKNVFDLSMGKYSGSVSAFSTDVATSLSHLLGVIPFGGVIASSSISLGNAIIGRIIETGVNQETQDILNNAATVNIIRLQNSSGDPAVGTYSNSVAPATTYDIDPSGSSTYTLTEDSASPSFASLTLPDMVGVTSFNVSFDVGGSWGATQIVPAEQALTAPAGATGISVQTLDSSGNPVVSISPVSLDVTFSSGGTFNGTLSASTPGLGVLDTTTGQAVPATAQTYTGPVANLQEQYINITPDNLNISVSTPNWFIHSGSGEDAIAVNSGTNVLDGGTGSNFLTGGSGTDTFFVDDRGPTADIWSTVVGFHAGDAATIWGVTPQDFGLAWVDGQGAAGFTGLTLHATAAGMPTASLTLAGYSQADMASGRLSVSFGTDPASGSAYMFVHGNS